MVSPDIASFVRDLYAVEPNEFVATRKRIAAELKAAGEGDASATLLKLRKPTVLEHALNETARSDPDAVDAWAAAVDAVGAAQSAAIGGGEAGPLREASAALRAATAALVKAATVHAGAAKSGEVAVFLTELATPTGTALLRHGVLGSADPGADSELFAGAPDPPARSGGRPSADRRAPAASPPRRRPDPASPQPVRGPSKQALQRHAAAMGKASNARDTAEREVRRLTAELDRAQHRLDAAEQALADLERSPPT